MLYPRALQYCHIVHWPILFLLLRTTAWALSLLFPAAGSDSCSHLTLGGREEQMPLAKLCIWSQSKVINTWYLKAGKYSFRKSCKVSSKPSLKITIDFNKQSTFVKCLLSNIKNTKYCKAFFLPTPARVLSIPRFTRLCSGLMRGGGGVILGEKFCRKLNNS